MDECPGIERKENPISFIPIKSALSHNTYFTAFTCKNIPRREVVDCIADTLVHKYEFLFKPPSKCLQPKCLLISYYILFYLMYPRKTPN